MIVTVEGHRDDGWRRRDRADNDTAHAPCHSSQVVSLLENFSYFRDATGIIHWPFGASRLDELRKVA